MSAVIGDIITPCYCHTWRCFWRRRSGCVHTITIGDAWVPNSDRCWWPLCGIIEGTCVIIFCLSKCLTFDIWCCTFWNFGNWWCTFWQKCLFRVTITNRYTLSISSTITRSYFTSCAWSCRRGFCWRQWQVCSNRCNCPSAEISETEPASRARRFKTNSFRFFSV